MRTFAMAGRFWYCVASALSLSACSESDAGSPRLAQAGGGGAAAAGAGAMAGTAGANAGATTGGVSVSGATSVGGTAGGSAIGGSENGASAGGGAGGTEPGGGAGQAGAGGSSPKTFLLPAFTGSAAKPSANLGTRNAGHEFAVTGEGVVVRELGVWDNGADGLAAPHVVTLFALDKAGAGAKATPVAGGTVTVPVGSAPPLDSGYRYTPLPAPVTLTAGNYAVVAYGFNANDLPGDGGGLPVPATGVADLGFDPYEFVGAASPAFPSAGDQNSHANASFRFESKLRPLRIMPLGASITDGYLGSMAGYRGPLKKLLDDAKQTFQFVGSWTDNPGTLPLPREQQHHEGHSGYVIQGGSSGRAGIYDFRNEWLGPTGSQADLFLIVIGTNDVDLDYQLDTAGQRLDALIDAILDPASGLQPNAKVILAQLPPINDAAEDLRCVSYNQTVVATVMAHAKKGQAITTVDLHSAITTSELADKLHPNDVGYGKVAKVFFDAIQNLNF
ncbi:MAG TPA: SGNH/GDSL hydrolase family protein [Polyangiaceae bacterium]|nr:SGNH/GDSL hydrolase family protein [Polyangiaceae bacterium]